LWLIKLPQEHTDEWCFPLIGRISANVYRSFAVLTDLGEDTFACSEGVGSHTETAQVGLENACIELIAAKTRGLAFSNAKVTPRPDIGANVCKNAFKPALDTLREALTDASLP
jgi:hypothetical protein